MKHSGGKRVLVFLLCALFMLSGCIGTQAPAANDNTEQILAEIEALKQQIDAAKADNVSNPVDTQVQAPAATPEPISVDVETLAGSVFGMHCTVNGQNSVPLDGETQVHAVADKVEGQEFDHWEFGDKTDYEAGPEATFTFSEPTILRATYRPRRVVKFINCHMNFMDSQGKAGGQSYTEFDFEEDYTNSVTKEACKGGEIDFYVTADVPKGKAVAYWLINDVKYTPSNPPQSFRVREQDEATVYEVVFYTPTTKPTSPPDVYYTVTCNNCTFSGGGHSGATSGKVKAGTTITITGRSSSSAAYFEGSPSSVNRGSWSSPMSGTYSGGKWTHSYSYVVNSDTTVSYYGIVN